jgi:hypothetical protein
MPDLTQYQLWYGRDEAPVETRTLRAGPVTCQLWGPDLRYLKRDGREVVRRLYVAVRDPNWNTIPGMPFDWQIEAVEDHFQVRFSVRHQQDPIDFTWQGEILGAADGTITYSMRGVAGRDFRYNRLGFCVLHPPSAAGRPYQGATPEGTITGTLPLRIGPQLLENGIYIALFPPVSDLTIEMEEDLTARFVFTGDLFEMEDQRNWTDASFKTYCTPLALPFPKQARAGQDIQQIVRITTEPRAGEEPAHAAPNNRATETVLRLEPGAPLGRTLPPLGLGMASHGEPLTEREIARLKTLRLAHLRADLHLSDTGYVAALERARQAADVLGCPLELALYVSDNAEEELTAFAAHLPLPLARLLIFHEQSQTTEARWVRLARERLGEHTAQVPFVGGANAYFCELNRFRPETEAMDGIVYSLNPQVHAFDEASLMETLAAQGETVTSTRAFSGGRPVIVSPVTFKPRFNANTTEPEPPTSLGQLPRPVDARQMSLFGAAWTLGSLKALAESGVSAATYFETTGGRGVMEAKQGSALPERFPSLPGAVFPLYHVFADVAEGAGGEILACDSPDPLRVLGFAFRDSQGCLHFLLANLTPVLQAMEIGALGTGSLRVRRLNTENVLSALQKPEAFRASEDQINLTGEAWWTTLAAYETVRIVA